MGTTDAHVRLADGAGAATSDEQPTGATDRLARLRLWARAIDVEPALVRLARALRRRLPGDPELGDVLSTAGRGPVQIVARGLSALQPERESLVRELSLSGVQLWQSLSEATGRGRGDRPLALLFTDLVAFSSWSLGAGDIATLELLRGLDAAHRVAIGAHGGQIAKRLGDGVMATFLTAQSAVEAALDLQHEVDAIQIGGYRPRMRAGVHWGRPRRLGGDYLGVDVNVAARVADAAGPGEVLVTGPVAKLLAFEGLRTGRTRRLRAPGAPPETLVQPVWRAG